MTDAAGGPRKPMFAQLYGEKVAEKVAKYGLRLDIGPGPYPRDTERFVTVDRYNEDMKAMGVPDPDINADMGDIPLDDNTVREIWCSHCLEHAPFGKVPLILKEWLRVLKPGGRLIVQVPNFDYVAKYWLTGPDRQWAEMMVFGQQKYGDGDFHRAAFTPATLDADLKGVGFKVLRVEMRWSHNQETVQGVAIKPEAAPRSPEPSPPEGSAHE